ncbi:YhdP family protein [Oleiagrimonas sp. MCCC 1A03011]|uniref:YhdP family protein n=1 Tax=Oleiagrimonas sp. MCCC 1A03011 TaxID=1926883 RepID=UPI000DC5B3CC|nr:YhdP family protein [Oleiagrimonas sp. MCCC 1A03011]RAP57446.1 TIGR02099 family protein [Oleiagrimonas sp. MCCC 1A03011]
MNKTWRQRLRRLRFVIGGLICIGLIALAVLIGLVQVLLPLAARYPDRVATMLSERLHQPVRFASMEGHWQASGPLLVLHDVRIGGRHGVPLRLPVADVKLDFGALLIPGRRLVNLRLVDVRLDLNRGADGVWSVAGFGSAEGAGAQQKLDLGQLPGSLSLDRLQMKIHDARTQRDWHLRSDALRVSNNGQSLRFAGRVRRLGVGSGLGVVGRMDLDADSGTVYVGGDKVDLGSLMSGVEVGGYGVSAGRGSLQFWLQWKHARVVSQTARVNLRGLDMHGPAGRTRLAHVQGLFGFDRDADGMRIRYAGADGAAARILVDGTGSARTVRARAQKLELATLLPLVAQVPSLPPSLAKWLLAAHPAGMVDAATLRWTAGGGIQAVDAGFSALTLAPGSGKPGIGPLRGRLFGDAEALLLELPAQHATLRMPGTFRKPIDFQRLQGDVAIWRSERAWHVGTGKFTFAGPGFGGQARGEVQIPHAGGKPFVDLYVALGKTAIPAAKQFWPVNAMPAGTVKWLDSSLVSGQLTHAEAVLRGDLKDWPFHHHEGRFEARGDIRDLVLRYNDKWPRAEGVHAIASFVDDGMLVRADAGQSRGNKVGVAVASIPQFSDAELVLSVEGSGSGASMLDFARNSPIASEQASALKQLKLGGRGDFDFSLVLPFDTAKDFTLAGTARIRGVDVNNPDWGLRLGKLTGALRFDGHGLRGRGLQAQFNGVPSRLDLALGSGATGDPSRPVSVTMHGHYDIATLVQGRPSLQELADVAKGDADFDIGFDIARTDAQDMRQTLHVESSLQGVALDLPAPLNKPAQATLPLDLNLRLPLSGGDLRVSLGDKAQAWAKLPTDDGGPLALSVALGATQPTTLPSSGIRVRGHGDDLDVSGWLQRALAARGQDGQGGPSLDSVDVTATHARVFGATFDDLRLRLTPQTGQILMQVDGPQAKGSLTLPTSDLAKRGVLARLDRLYWPDESATNAAASTQAAAPASAASVAPPSVNYADTGIAPAEVPPLHVSVGDLRLGKAHLGDARFESWPTAKGMHIDQLRTHNSDVQIMGSGDWVGSATNSHTNMTIDFGAENLGSLLNALGFGGLFEGGRTRAHLQATWPGEPSSLALQRMDGTLDVEVSKGRIPEVQPGVGRLFGLMALTELPRRLSLDFGDVFGKGFGFDSIKGRFRLADGFARTDDLQLKGPAADIRITGATNLRDKTYDQRILVVPHIGNSLPVVGALAGGPVGAAAGLAVQGLLGRGLNKAASARYSLTGSWDKPKITLLEKTAARAVPARSSSASAVSEPGTAAPAVSDGASASSRPAASGSSPSVPASATSAGRR